MTTTTVTATGVDERALRSLRSWNLGLTPLHVGHPIRGPGRDQNPGAHR